MDERQPRRRRRRQDAPIVPDAPDASLPPKAQENKNDAPHEEGAQDNENRRRRRRTNEPQATHAVQTDELFWHPENESSGERGSEPAKSHGKLIGAFASFDALVCRLGDAMLFALQWAVIGLMFLLGFAADGGKKLISAVLRLSGKKRKRNISGSRHTGKRMPAKVAQGDPTVTLEPTKATDYRGISQKRGKKRVVRAPGRKLSVGYCATMAALLCVAVVSTYMTGSILWRSISTKRLNASLSRRYSDMEATGETPEPSMDEEVFLTTLEAPDDMLGEQNEFEVFETLEWADEPAEPSWDDPEEPPIEVQETAPTPTATPHPADVVKTTKFHQYGGDALPEMEALYKENRDLVGWLRMEGILDLPVVYKDNSYYLTHDFYKNKSVSGTLFLDVNHPFRDNAQNLLLHGHNMKDGTMFGRLVQYETNLQFLKNNPFIQYSTLWEKEQYVIFAVLHVSLDVTSDEFFNYFTHASFSTDAQFETYVRSLQNRSVFSIPINVEPSDALLTLSTCLDEDRLVIVARRVRDGESKSELRHQVQLAAKQ